MVSQIMTGDVMANNSPIRIGKDHTGYKLTVLKTLALSLAAGAAVFGFSLLATPLYHAQTRILIEPGELVYSNTTAQSREAIAFDSAGLTSQVDIMLSAELLTKVSSSLNLASYPEFSGAPSLVEKSLFSLGIGRDPASIPANERLLHNFRNQLDVYRVQDSRVIVIGFNSEDPVLAAEVANGLASAYIALQDQRSEPVEKAGQQNSAVSVMETLHERVVQAETNLRDFLGQMSADMSQRDLDQKVQELQQLNSELSQSRIAKSALETKIAALGKGIESGASVESLLNSQQLGVIQRLRQQQSDLRAQIAEQSITYLSNHPRIRALQTQLADVNAGIANEARMVLAALEAEVFAAEQSEQKLIHEQERRKAEILKIEAELAKLRQLESNVADARKQQQDKQAEQDEQALNASTQAARYYLPVGARVLSPAIAPMEAYFPKIIPMTLAAFVSTFLLLGLFGLLGAGSRRERLSSGSALSDIGATEQVRASRTEPVDEEISPLRGHNIQSHQINLDEIDQFEANKSASAEGDLVSETPFRDVVNETDQVSLKSNTEIILEKAPSTRQRIMEIDMAVKALLEQKTSKAIFISPEGDEAAVTAVQLARAIARKDLRVLLMDLTIAGAVTVPMLETLSLPGITNLMSEDSQFADVIHTDRYSGCHVIPIGTIEPERAMQGIDRLPIILTSLAGAYDMIIVECGPASAEAVQRLADNEIQVMVSAVDPTDADVLSALQALHDTGLGEPFLVMAAFTPPSTAPLDAA